MCLMSTQIESLRMRVGIEAFFCVFRSMTEFYCTPHSYFTHPELEDYLGLIASKRSWSMSKTAAMMEAFAITGCDVAGIFIS